MDRLLSLLRTVVFVGVSPALAAERAPQRPIDLSPPKALAETVAPGASLLRQAPPPIEPGLYVGPASFSGDEARDVRRMLRALPRPIRRAVLGRVGPWGIASESLGVQQWSAGLGVFARF
jgi:hypothetical protein